MEPIGMVVLAAALVLVAGAAWWLRVRDGAVRPAASDGDSRVVEVLGRMGIRPGAAELTVVQFSTAFCAPCRATRARLQHLQASRPGLAYVDVDAEDHLAEVRELDVRRTPTLFYLGPDGSLLGRSSGAPRPEVLGALVAAHVGTGSAGRDG